MGAGNVRGLTLNNWRAAVALAALSWTVLIVSAVPPGATERLARALVVQPAASRAVAATPQFPQDDYTFHRVSDTGAPEWADGVEIPDVWMPHGWKVERILFRGGHRLEPRTCDSEGFAELRFDIQRK
jgi:hypothetical protein